MNREIQILDAVAEDAVGIQIVQREGWLDTYPTAQMGITREDIEAKVDFNNEERTKYRAKRIQEDQATHYTVPNNLDR